MRWPALMLVTPAARADGRPPEETVEAAVSAGVDAVLLRDAPRPPRPLLEAARRLRAVVQGRALLLVHGDPALAIEAGADGVHLPAGAAFPPRTQLGHGLLLGRSVHSVEEARLAAARGADYATAGTIFSSDSHPGRRPAGLDGLNAICAATFMPVLAIGGVAASDAAACLKAGAAGIAALSPFARTADPGATAQSYRRELDSTPSIEVSINGRKLHVCAPATVAQLLALRRLPGRLLVVERNRRIVPSREYGRTLLADGDALELVQMTAGG